MSLISDPQTMALSARTGQRPGGRLPQDRRVLNKWIKQKVQQVKAAPEPLVPVMQDLQNLLDTHPDINTLFTTMLTEVPATPRFQDDPAGDPEIRDVPTLLQTFNRIIQEAPTFVGGGEDGYQFVGLPINAILDWPMGTPSGMLAFANPLVNQSLNAILNYWAAYLASSASTSVLTTDADGWFGPTALSFMPNFAETYECDPSAPAWGFASYDAFFSRALWPGVRPVAFPDRDDIINSACESTVYRISADVQASANILLKGQPYCLADMLANDPAVPQLAGGTVYQAYLNLLDYHRWHAPVNGTVVRTALVPGAYYLEAPEEGFPHPDAVAQNLSQAFITSVAARALVFIQADSPKIGLMCFVAVGMGETSSCEFTVAAGQRVSKGDQMGIFHFGGSTHCLVFGPQVQLNWAVAVNEPVDLNGAIASVS